MTKRIDLQAQIAPGCVPSLLLYAVLLASLAGNLFTLMFISYGWTPMHVPDDGSLPVSEFSGLGRDMPVVYRHHTPYWGMNETLADELWDAIDTNPMVVALTDEYAREHRLDLSSRWPWDHTKGRYFIKMFHSLHCLKYIRKNFMDLYRHNGSTLAAEHTQHCLDLLRKDILCYGDDTPMPTNEQHTAIGDRQVLMCRSYDKLVDWIYAPERNACHNSLNEYRRIKHPIERYAFCDEKSPGYMAMQAYFHEHGHVDPYER